MRARWRLFRLISPTLEKSMECKDYEIKPWTREAVLSLRGAAGDEAISAENKRLLRSARNDTLTFMPLEFCPQS
jgi:hypothetical protein